MMRIPYNVAYQVNYILKDGKRPTSRILYEADEVDVPAVSGTDAPVVATWKSEDRTKSFEVRAFDGHYYEPIWQGRHRLNVPTDAKAAFTAYLEPEDKAGTMPPTSKIAYNLGDTRDVNVAAARQLAEGFLVVDGIPYRRCAQPRLMLHIRYDDYELTILTDDYEYDTLGRVKGIDTHVIAPLKDEARLIEIAEMREGRIWYRYRDVDILVPELLDFDTKVEACARTVAQGIIDNQRDIFFWPRPVAEELLAIRAEYRLWRQAPDEVNGVDLLDRVFAIYTTYNLYNQQLVCGFLGNYETVQKNLPEYEVTIDIKAPRAEP
ncbi:hypothetical protein OIU34_20320 [Pararhizobium sp. BT-229]|uniref:hypothetical protein n=1 Tax=Pararhizobium sp. BT-229 TaxID=2986923 RepID=UPI0021F7E595|nr:hypothetical protein [Pararhizobium sp. BT-229]MCV9964234.1 hypothetical protein [Pararhizobium sp. BT-229]